MNTHPSQSGNILPRFYMGSKQSKEKTMEAGYPIFKEVEMVEIRIAGDNKTVIHKKVDEEIKRRWPDHYQAFKKGSEAPIEGLHLKHCPLFSEAQVRTLQGQNIHTVEALSELPDSFLTRLGMGARALQAKAKAYIKDAEGTKEVTKLAAENQRMKAEIEMLKRQISELDPKPTVREDKVTPIFKAVEDPNPDPVEKERPKTFDEAGFSARTQTTLTKNGISTIDELFLFGLDDIAAMPGIGISAMDEITRLVE